MGTNKKIKGEDKDVSYNDYVAYIDTDSNYIKIYQWLEDNGVSEQFDVLELEDQIKYIQRIGKEIENYVNKKSFTETQKSHYNSQVDDFSIVFEQEKIATAGFWKAKKKYATWTLMDGGKWKDEMSITGLEIIRGDSPEVVKPLIKEVLKMMLKFESDSKIREYIDQCKKNLKEYSPSEIAENKTINKISKYIKEDGYIKGTPHQLKGLYNMKILLNKYDLNKKYDLPQEGNKAKIVYLQKNPFNMNSLTFLVWPEELVDKGIKVDYDKMIRNNFIRKIEDLLVVVDKKELIRKKINLTTIFGGE